MSSAAWSVALRDIPAPHYADATIVPLPWGAPTDPGVWARTMFDLRTMPRWVSLALGVRQALVPLLGIPPAPRDTFAVREIVRDAAGGGEALMSVDDTHLDFRCAVAVDADARLVRVTTTVRLKGARGRLYFAPVRLAHPVVVASMLNRACRLLDPPFVL